MTLSTKPGLLRAYARDLYETLWPPLLPDDPESQRRRKIAVRSAQIAVVALVFVPVVANVATDFRQTTLPRLGGLLLACITYILWSLHGLRKTVRSLFWEDKTTPPPQLGLTRLEASFYFGVQLFLAAVICHLSAHTEDRRLAWLVLLPPIAHSVILLRRTGIILVSLLSMSVLVANVVVWRGWELVPAAITAFSFSVLFTLIFTLLTVSSEKSRAEVERLASELVEANRKLRQYAVGVEELAMTRERNRLAREVHDTLGHYLTVVNVQIEAARILMDRDPNRGAEPLAKAQSLTLEGLQEIRRSVSALRASPLDNRTLTDALRHVLDENRAAGLNAEMQVLGEARALSPQAELTLYRAGQEGLTNVRKHAHGAQARMELDFRDQKRVRLRVIDNGAENAKCGGKTDGFGLMGLRERANLLGGALVAQAVPGQGFTLEVEIPE